MELEFGELRHDLEHRRAHQHNVLLEILLGQHVLHILQALNEGVPPDQIGARLVRVHERLESIVKKKVATSAPKNEAFNRVVSELATDLIRTPETVRTQSLRARFSALYAPAQQRHARVTCDKLSKWMHYREQLIGYDAAKRDEYYTRAWNAVVAAMELGAWLDATL